MQSPHSAKGPRVNRIRPTHLRLELQPHCDCLMVPGMFQRLGVEDVNYNVMWKFQVLSLRQVSGAQLEAHLKNNAVDSINSIPQRKP